jgi:hypothetical protein
MCRCIQDSKIAIAQVIFKKTNQLYGSCLLNSGDTAEPLAHRIELSCVHPIAALADLHAALKTD